MLCSLSQCDDENGMSRNAQDLYLSCKGWLNNEGYGCMMTCWMTFLSTSGVKKIRSFLGFPCWQMSVSSVPQPVVRTMMTNQTRRSENANPVVVPDFSELFSHKLHLIHHRSLRPVSWARILNNVYYHHAPTWKRNWTNSFAMRFAVTKSRKSPERG